MKLFQYLLPGKELLKKMFPAILDTKNSNKVQKNFQYSTKDRMTHFNIFVDVKRRRDNYFKVRKKTVLSKFGFIKSLKLI